MDVARLNFSHGTHSFHREIIERVRGISDDLKRPIAILQDLPGPKIRIGSIEGGMTDLRKGSEVRFVAEDVVGTSSVISLPHAEILAAMEPDSYFYLADGLLRMKVLENLGSSITAKVIAGGSLGSHKGVNVPDAKLDLPPATELDLEHLRFGMEMGVDWVAVSFVASPKDVVPFRKAAEAFGSPVKFMAKIERRQALDYLDEIVDAFDGVLVARGDLGIETPISDVPIVQKRLIKKCLRAGKPAVVATQMLMSMVDNPRPTRAEVTDIANAILDGADAVMLSEETAVGRYPLDAVRTMSETAVSADTYLAEEAPRGLLDSEELDSVVDAIAHSAAEMADNLKVAAILCCTASGETARAVSKHRPSVPILAAVSSEYAYNQLSLRWGVRSFKVPPPKNTDEMISTAVAGAIDTKLVKPHDWVIIVAGVQAGVPGNTSLIKYHKVGDAIWA